MSCLITSPRERGGKDLESSTCSLSWRRQCCPADRRCTELLRRGGAAQAWGVSVCVLMYVLIAMGKQKGLWNSVLEMRLKRNWGQKARSKVDRRAIPAGEGQVYTGRVCLPTSPRGLTQVRSPPQHGSTCHVRLFSWDLVWNQPPETCKF